MEKKIPLRMCIACREMKPKKQMLRIVKSNDNIALDFKGKAAGRGAYICDNPECIKKCLKSRLLNKTFKCSVSDDIYARIKEDYDTRINGIEKNI